MKMPQGKVLIPGVISHATNVVEHPEPGGRDFMGPEWVIASTDCGFPQGPFGCRGRPSIMCPKLRVFSDPAMILPLFAVQGYNRDANVRFAASSTKLVVDR